MKFLAPLLALAATVAAHGYVDNSTTNGVSYTGFLPDYDLWQKPDPARITRKIPDDGPVFDFTSKDLTCNVGAQDAQWRTSSHAPVNAGDQFTFHWCRWPVDHKGPITVWMAACGDSCTDFDATGNVWFKIDQLGLVSGETDTGVWASGLLITNNLQWTVTIPKTLKPGAYLLRMEILALHSAHAPQFYPSCQQIVVSGSGSDAPSASDMVAIPGYYKNDTSTNIDIWQNGQTTYPIAGPNVVSFAAFPQTGSDPANTSGGLKLAAGLKAGPIVTSSSVSSTSGGSTAASSSSDAGSASNTTSTDDSGSSTDDSSSPYDAAAADTGSSNTSSAPATNSSPATKSCQASRKKRDLKKRQQGASKSKRHTKRRLASY